jgi:hypothetical protein
MRVELKNTQGAAALSMHLLRIQLLVLLNDELLIVMCPERIFLASETSTCIHQRFLSFRTTTSLILPFELFLRRCCHIGLRRHQPEKIVESNWQRHTAAARKVRWRQGVVAFNVFVLVVLVLRSVAHTFKPGWSESAKRRRLPRWRQQASRARGGDDDPCNG